MGHPGRTSGTMARDLCMWAGPHPTAWKVDGNHVRPLQGRPVVRSSVFAEFPVNLYNFAGGSAAKLLFEKFNKIFDKNKDVEKLLMKNVIIDYKKNTQESEIANTEKVEIEIKIK